jgi:cytochrome c-type biogenesis protein CcmE
MKAKHQRMTLVILAVLAMIGAVLLAMSALRDQAAYFYTPSDAQRDNVETGRAIRLGGMVVDRSIKRDPDGVSIRFIVTDGTATVPVSFKGITPDLFKENSGVVAEGAFDASKTFIATNILAKHDERYMPPQIAREMKAEVMHKTESLSR